MVKNCMAIRANFRRVFEGVGATGTATGSGEGLPCSAEELKTIEALSLLSEVEIPKRPWLV